MESSKKRGKKVASNQTPLQQTLLNLNISQTQASVLVKHECHRTRGREALFDKVSNVKENAESSAKTNLLHSPSTPPRDPKVHNHYFPVRSKDIPSGLYSLTMPRQLLGILG